MATAYYKNIIDSNSDMVCPCLSRCDISHGSTSAGRNPLPFRYANNPVMYKFTADFTQYRLSRNVPTLFVFVNFRFLRAISRTYKLIDSNTGLFTYSLVMSMLSMVYPWEFHIAISNRVEAFCTVVNLTVACSYCWRRFIKYPSTGISPRELCMKIRSPYLHTQFLSFPSFICRNVLLGCVSHSPV